MLLFWKKAVKLVVYTYMQQTKFSIITPS